MKRLLTICAVAALLLTTNAAASLSQLNGTSEPGPADPVMPLDGTWVRLIEVMAAPAFFTGTYTWNSPLPVKFTITDWAVVTDRFEVYDFGILKATTPLLPDWYALGLPDPLTSPPWTIYPDVALADGRFSSAVINFAAGAHSITIRDIHIPLRSPGGVPFTDGTVAFKAVPEPATVCLLGLGGLAVMRRRRLYKMTKVKINHHQFWVAFIVAAMIVAFAAANVSAKVYYPSGMVGYWKFNGSLIDELGIYNGTMGPYGSYADGIIDQGLHGARACSNPFAAKVDNFPNLDSFTVEAWIKPACPPGSWQTSLTVAKWAGGYGGTGFMLVTWPSPFGSSNYVFALSIGEGSKTLIAISPLTYPCGNWYHVVGIRDYGKELKLFVNGEEVASVLDNVVGSIANTMPLTFHGYVGGGCGWGMSEITMDEVAIYDRVLSEGEIQQHCQNGLHGLGYEIVAIPIDIKPGNVPVVILSSATFDALTVDQSTVEFAGAHPLPNYCSQLGGIPEDVDGDGLLDIVFYFETADLNLPPGDMEACLTGRTFSGQEFRGCESICLLGPVVGDLSNDYKIDFKDFAIFASHWLECPDPNCE
jgi:hypothetical protein